MLNKILTISLIAVLFVSLTISVDAGGRDITGKYSNDRNDYPHLSDKEFANFRVVKTTGMGKNALYRTATPLRSSHNRNKYADKALKEKKIKCVINLSDSKKEAKNCKGYKKTYYVKTNHIEVNMKSNYGKKDFNRKFAKAIRYMNKHKGRYAIHCVAGKDRTGFTVAVLECLMGATYNEVMKDYMKTFENYYGITKKSPRYEKVLNAGIRKQLKRVFDVDDLKTADLSKEAYSYLRTCGLKKAEIKTLKRNLSKDYN